MILPFVRARSARPGLWLHLPWAGCFLAALGFVPLAGRAQPSGGPYGPLPHTYAVPAGAAHVYYVAPDGQADAAGTAPAAPTTLESAIARVVTGDVVVLRGGVYRTGGLRLNQGITLQPYGDEHPVLKGTRVAAHWTALPHHVWKTSWSPLFPARPLGWWQRDREGMRTPLHRFNDDLVFVDGQMLQSAGWEGELDAHSYYIDYQTGTVYLGTDPTNRLVEITAFDSALVRTSGPCHGKVTDHRGPIIRGLTFTQYARLALDIEGRKPTPPVNEEPTNEPEGPADPSTYGKETTATVLDNVTITYCGRVAGYFRGDGLVIRHCLVSDTSTEGVYIIGSSDVLLEKNIFRRNNIEKLTGYYPAAVKIFNQCHRVTCRDNLIIDQPDSNGVWYDVGNVDGRFLDNWVEGAQVGFFFEISKGAVCAGNVFVRCQSGIRVLNSSNVEVCHNTFLDCPAVFGRNERSATNDHFGWHPATGPDLAHREGHSFVGNLLVADAGFTAALLRCEQSRALCGQLTRPQLARLDGNAYIRRGDGAPGPLIAWSPAAGDNCTAELATPEALHQLQPEFAAHDQYFSGYHGAVLRGEQLQRYELLTDTPVRPVADSLPETVRALLGWPAQAERLPGAYPTPP